jgi:hypothetical protein
VSESNDLKIVELLPKDAGIYYDAIQLLESVIEQVRQRAVFGVAIVTLHQDRSVGTAYSQGMKEDYFHFIGGLETLKNRAMQDLLER